MILFKKTMFPALIAIAVFAIPACKAKKPLVQPPAAAVPAPAPAKPAPSTAEEKKPAPEPQRPTSMALPPQPDYNFSNIQFEFNSAVLKTGSYAVLDKAVMEMKKDPSAKLMLNGYASAEGTAQHNLTLSAGRANAVKLYLINAGISSDNLTANGYGDANPISANTDEKGRAINRRVELRKQ